MTVKMKQIQMSAFGGPHVLQTSAVDRPEPGPGELLIQVTAAGVNYSDVMRRKNVYFMPTPLPYVPGAEVVGTVVARGAGIDHSGPFAPGQSVLAILPAGGGYAEYVTNPAQYCVPLPPRIDATQAVAAFVQGSTAHLLIHRIAPDLQNKTIVIHAAAGGLGSMLVQLAKREGARVIGTAGTEAKRAAARTFGADEVVDYTRPDWPSEVVRVNDHQKVDCVFEMVGGEIFTRSFECLKYFGAVITYGTAGGAKGVIDSESCINLSHNVLSFNLAHFINERGAEWQESLGAVKEMIARGDLRVPVHSPFALDQAAAAHDALENRRTTGKVVLVP